jgi:hypothetical protein
VVGRAQCQLRIEGSPAITRLVPRTACKRCAGSDLLLVDVAYLHRIGLAPVVVNSGLRLRFSYYDLRVVEETNRGRPVTEEQIQVWADEAEKGFPVERLRKRGRRPVGDGPGEMITVRMDEALLAQLAARAERAHVTRSEAIRAAVKAWIGAE